MLVNSYNYNLTASYNYGTVSISAPFKIHILDKCSVTVINSDPIVDQFYDIQQPAAQNVALLFWNQTQACPAIVYSMIDLITTVFPNPIIFTQPVNNHFQIYTTNAGDVGVYQLQAIGTVPAWTYSTREFILTITNVCGGTIVTPTPINDHYYNVFQPRDFFQIPDWSSSFPQCKPFQFTLAITKLSGASSTSFINFYSNNRTFDLYTNLIANADEYTITVTGIAAGGVTGVTVFKIIVTNQCANATISVPAGIVDYRYIITDVTLVQQVPAFVCSYSYCPIAYTLTNANLSPVTPLIFTGFTYEPPVFSAYTTDNTLQNLYPLKLSGTLQPNGPAIANYNFNLDVVDQCYLDQILGAIMTDEIYDLIFASPYVITNTWVQSMPSVCPPLVIRIVDFSLQNWPNPMFCTPLASNSFQIYTQDLGFQWTNYTINVQASVAPYVYREQNFTLQITNYCPMTIIYPSAILDQTVMLYQPTTIAFMQPWITTFQFCYNFTYDYQIIPRIVMPGVSTTSAISFDAASLQFSIYCSNKTEAGTYTVAVGGVIPNKFFSNITYNVTIINQCLVGTLTNPTPLSYTYTVSQSTLSPVLPDFSSSQPLCPINYTLSYSNYSHIDSSVVTFHNSNHSMDVYTLDNSKVGTHPLRLSGNYFDGPSSTSYTFSLIIKHQCTLSVITTIPIPFTIVDISMSYTTIIQDLAWTQTLSAVCPNITYTWTYSGSVTLPDPTVFTLTGSLMSAFTNNPAKIGIYALKAIGSVSTYATGVKIFIVQISDQCPTASVIPVVIPNQLGNIYAAPQLFTFGAWNYTPSFCGNFTYTFTATALSTGNPALILLNERTFTFQSSNLADTDKFMITVNGTLPRGVWAITKFNLTMSNDCAIATLSPPASITTPYSYIASQTALIQTLDNFVLSSPGCILTYTLTKADNSPLDTMLVTNFNTATNTMTIYTTDNSYVGPHDLKLSATVNNGIGASNYNFRVNIVHQCSLTTIIPVMIPNSTFDISEIDPLCPAFFNWTQSWPSICPPLIYSLYDTVLLAIPDPTVFWINGSNHINIFTTNIAYVGDYILQVKATNLPYAAVAYQNFNVSITNKCPTSVVTPTAIPDQQYAVTDPTYNWIFVDFGKEFQFCGAFTYTIVVTAAGIGDPNIVIFSSATRTFQVQTNNFNNRDTYNIDLTGTLPSGAFATVTFDLRVLLVCEAATVILPTITQPYHIQYIVTNTLLDTILPLMNSSNPSCTVQYSLTQLDGSPFDSSYLLSFNDSTTQTTVYTTNPAHVGYHNLTLTGSIIGGLRSSNYSFALQIKDLCALSLISAYTMPFFTFDLNEIIVPLSLGDLNWTQSNVACPGITYRIVDAASHAPADPTVFSVNTVPSVPQGEAFTNDFTKAGLYRLAIEGSNGGNAYHYENVDVNITYNCLWIPGFTTPTILQQTLDLFTGLQGLTFAGFSTAKTYCGAFTYTFTVASPPGLNGYGFISLNSLMRTFFYGTNLNSDVGLYNLTVIGTLASGAFISTPFSLTVRNPCIGVTIVKPTGFIYFSYSVNAAPSTFTLPSFNITNSICQFNYTLTLQDGTPYSYDIIHNFNPSLLTLPVWTFNNNDVGVYNLTLRGDLLGGNISSSYNFTLRILDQCTLTTITTYSDTQTYYLPMNIAYYAFYYSQTLGVLCPPITYSIIDTATGLPPPSSIFQFISQDTLQIYGSTVYDIGTYNLQVTATVNGFATAQNTLLVFLVSYVDCNNPQIYDSYLNYQQYRIGTGTMLIEFTPWQEATGLCGKFKYSFTVTARGKGNPGIIGLMSDSTTFTVFSNNNDDADVYLVTLIAYLPTVSYYMQFYVYVYPFVCKVTSLVQSNVEHNYVYYVSASQVSIKVPDFKQDPDCSLFVNVIFGQLVGSSQQALPPFIKTTNSKKYLLVQTNLRQYVGKYTLYALGYVINQDRSQVKDYIIINLSVLWPFDGTTFNTFNSPPYFLSEPEDIYVLAGEMRAVRLPAIQDQQRDMYTVKPSFYSAQSFITFSKMHLIVTPKKKDVGSYGISIRLTDLNQNPMWRDYSLNVIVQKNLGLGNGPEPFFNLTTAYGLLIIAFDVSLKVPSKWRQIDPSVLLIRIKNDAGYRNINFTWHMVQFTSSYMIIQMVFKDHLQVSNDIINVRIFNCSFGQPEFIDSIKIKFLRPPFFINQATNVQIELNYTISGQIPKQDDSLERFELIQQTTTAVDLYYKSLVAITSALAAASSLPNPVWPLIQSLQMVANIPLASENPPYQAREFLRALKTLSNFEYFKAFNVSNPDVPMEIQDRESRRRLQDEQMVNGTVGGLMTPASLEYWRMGYHTQNQIIELKSIFYYSMFLAYVVVTLLVLKVVSKAADSIVLIAVYSYLADIFFFDFIIRFTLIFYMEYAITSLISIQNTSFDSPADTVSSFHAIIFTLITSILPGASFLGMLKYQQELELPLVQEKIGSLYMTMKPSLAARLHYPIFLLRRQAICVALVIFMSYPMVQLQCFVMLSVMSLTYLIAVRPHQSKLLNVLEIVNELITLGCMYHLFIFTDFVRNHDVIYLSGWSLIILILTMIASNTLIIFMLLFHHVIAICAKMNLLIRRYCMRPPKTMIKYNYVVEERPLIPRKALTPVIQQEESIDEPVREATPIESRPTTVAVSEKTETNYADYLLNQAQAPRAVPLTGVWKYWTPNDRILKEEEMEKLRRNEEQLERRAEMMKANLEHQKQKQEDIFDVGYKEDDVLGEETKLERFKPKDRKKFKY